jgi:glucose uptake protein
MPDRAAGPPKQARRPVLLMILPQTYAGALFILVIALVCQSAWASTYKMAGERASGKIQKLRYELYYFDWIVGAFLCVAVIALTVGSLGFDGFSFRDDLMIAPRRQWLYAFLAGVLFGFENALLLASLSVAGMAVAFPVASGVSVVVAAAIGFATIHNQPVTFLVLGCCLALAAAVAAALAYRVLLVLRHEEAARAGTAKSTRRPPSGKPLILASVAGLLWGSIFPLADRAQAGDTGLGPYSFGFLYTFGAAASAVLLNLFLMNLPVEGEPLEIPDYVRGGFRKHLYGLAGGAIWGVGLVTALIPTAAALPAPARTGPAVTYLLTQAAAPLAALWGIFIWKELRGADGRVAILAGLTIILLTGGIGVLAVAPLYAAR